MYLLIALFDSQCCLPSPGYVFGDSGAICSLPAVCAKISEIPVWQLPYLIACFKSNLSV